MGKILVAGYERLVINTLAQFLKRDGHETTEARTLADIERVCLANRPDLVVMHDLEPGWIELAERLQNDGVPVLLTTINPGAPNIRRFKELSWKRKVFCETVAEMLATKPGE